MKLKDVERNYGAIAATYDFWTDTVFHRLLGLYRWRLRAIDMLGDIEGARVLEVGCGTGNSLPLLMPRIGQYGSVVALDYCAGMLKEARSRARSAGWPNIDFVRDDAAHMAWSAQRFDAALSVWCLGIVYDLPAALTRLLECVRPGARIAILDFDHARPERGWLRRMYPIYRRLLMASGVDAPEDLDEMGLRARWRQGIEFLEPNLEDFEVARYLYGAGILLHGTCRGPNTAPGTATE